MNWHPITSDPGSIPNTEREEGWYLLRRGHGKQGMLPIEYVSVEMIMDDGRPDFGGYGETEIDIEFIEGLSAREPHERAPDFIKCRLSIKREQLIAWLQQREGEWVNVDVKESKNGNWYCAVDSWKPKGGQAAQGRAPQAEPDLSDDIPW